MILGRPVNLWLGAVTAVLNALVLLGVVQLDGIQMAGINVAAGSLIFLVANATPTLKEGTEVIVRTPEGEPDRRATI